MVVEKDCEHEGLRRDNDRMAAREPGLMGIILVAMMILAGCVEVVRRKKQLCFGVSRECKEKELEAIQEL